MEEKLARMLWRLVRFHLWMPRWARVPVVGAVVAAVAMGLRTLPALPRLARGEESLADLLLAFGAAIEAGFVGGLGYSLTRPRLRRFGRAGDYASGVATVWSYLGALLFASPFVFERSAIPSDATGWLAWLGVATAAGLMAGHVWFGRNGFGADALARSVPRLKELRPLDDLEAPPAALVGGWVRRIDLERLLAIVERLTGARIGPEVAVRLGRDLARVSSDERLEVELEGDPPVPFLLIDEAPGILRFELILLEELAARGAQVREALSGLTIDPLTAVA